MNVNTPLALARDVSPPRGCREKAVRVANLGVPDL
jgi:hypothetical protein